MSEVESRPNTRRGRRGNLRKSLSLHGLSADHRCGVGRGRDHAKTNERGGCMTDRYVPDAPIPSPRREKAPHGEMRWIGKPMKRVEDPKLLTGNTKYVADIYLPGMAHAALLRSPVAHALIKSTNLSRPQPLPVVIPA